MTGLDKDISISAIKNDCSFGVSMHKLFMHMICHQKSSNNQIQADQFSCVTTLKGYHALSLWLLRQP